MIDRFVHIECARYRRLGYLRKCFFHVSVRCMYLRTPSSRSDEDVAIIDARLMTRSKQSTRLTISPTSLLSCTI